MRRTTVGVLAALRRARGPCSAVALRSCGANAGSCFTCGGINSTAPLSTTAVRFSKSSGGGEGAATDGTGDSHGTDGHSTTNNTAVTSETPPTSSDSTDSKGTSAAVDTPKSSGSSEDQDGGARGGDGGDGDGGGGGGGDKEPVEEHTDEPEGPSLGDTFACVSGESLPEDARVHPDFLDKVEPSRVWTTFMLHMFLPTLDPSFSAPDFLDGAKQAFDVVQRHVRDGNYAALRHMCLLDCATSIGTMTAKHGAPHVDLEVVDASIVNAPFARVSGLSNFGATNNLKVFPTICVKFDVLETNKEGHKEERVHVWHFTNSEGYLPHTLPDLGEVLGLTEGRERKSGELEWIVYSYAWPVDM